MVVVVVAVSKASSGRAWQSSSSYLYIYSILLKRIRSRVFFWCVFGELFLAREIFFSLFFLCTPQVKNTTNTHYKKKLPLPKFMRVCLRVSVV